MTEAVNVVLGLQAGSFATEGKKVEKALGAIGDRGEASARQIAAATRGLPAQFTDIATQLAGGQNPFLVLLQQGGQIKDQFGGIGAAARGIAAAVSPAVLGIGSLAAGIGTLLFGLEAGRRESNALRDSLILTGNAAGVTADGVTRLSAAVADGSRQTVGGAREILNALISSGRSSSAVLESQALAIARLADVSGKAGKDIAGSFAAQLEAPARFAAELNKSYNFLTVAEFRRIQSLESAGKAAEAARFTNERLAASLEGQRAQLGTLERGWDDIAKTLGRYKQALLDLGKPETFGAVVANQARALDGANRQLAGNQRRGSLSRAGIASLVDTEAEAESLRELRRAQGAMEANAAAISTMRADARDAIADLGSPKGGAQPRQEPPVWFDVLDAMDGRIKLLKAAEEGLSAIRDSTEATRAEFLRSEKGAYDDTNAKRLQAEQDLLQALQDENARAGIALIEDERQRGLALIALDREIAVRRAKAADLGDEALGRAISLIDRSAALSGQKLDADLDRAAARAGDAMAESISDGILNGFRNGSSLIDIFTRELKAQFARTVLTPLIRPTVDAGNGLIGQLIRGAIGAFSGTLTVDPNGMGLSPGAADFATGDAIRGRRAGGGRVSPHSTYLVGERGPELLRMGGDGGRVLPTPAAGGVNVSMPVSVHIDARSDQAQVAQLVTSAVADAQRRMYEDLRARRVIG